MMMLITMMRFLLLFGLSLHVPSYVTAFGIARINDGNALWSRRQRQLIFTTSTTTRSSLYSSLVNASEWNQKKADTASLKNQPTSDSSSSVAALQGSQKEFFLVAMAKAVFVKARSLARHLRSQGRWKYQQKEAIARTTAEMTVWRYQSEGPLQQPPDVQAKPSSSQKSPIPPPRPRPPSQSNDSEEKQKIMVDVEDVTKNDDDDDDDDDGVTLGDIMGTLLVTDAMADVLAPPPGVMNTTKRTKKDNKQHYTTRHHAATTTLAERYGIHHPLDRMALTANGNLQRLVSSYYDAPVSVSVVECTARPPQIIKTGPTAMTTTMMAMMTTMQQMDVVVSKTWDRLVHLSVHDQVFCTARSVITVTDPLCVKLIESGQVGIGQLFRYLDLLPEFVLLDAGPSDEVVDGGGGDGKAGTSQHGCSGGAGGGGGFWREYTLQSTSISCHIFEEFCPNLWQLQSKK